jgi:hypothetical protein
VLSNCAEPGVGISIHNPTSPATNSRHRRGASCPLAAMDPVYRPNRGNFKPNLRQAVRVIAACFAAGHKGAALQTRIRTGVKFGSQSDHAASRVPPHLSPPGRCGSTPKGAADETVYGTRAQAVRTDACRHHPRSSDRARRSGRRNKPLGDVFIKAIRIVVTPIIFTTIVVGVAKTGDLRQIARLGVRALVYFEVISTLALLVGLAVENLWPVGSNINADPQAFDPMAVADFVNASPPPSLTGSLLNIVPSTFLDPLYQGRNPTDPVRSRPVCISPVSRSRAHQTAR